MMDAVDAALVFDVLTVRKVGCNAAFTPKGTSQCHWPVTGAGGGNARPQGLMVGLTAQRLTRAARARVPKPTRRTACTHVSRAMQAARRRSDFDFTSRLGRRAEAGPRRVLPRVRPSLGF